MSEAIINDFMSIPGWVCRNLAKDLACAVNVKTYKRIANDLKYYFGNIPYAVTERKEDGKLVGYTIKVLIGSKVSAKKVMGNGYTNVVLEEMEVKN